MGSARKRALVLLGVLAGVTASQLTTGVAGASPAPVASPLGFDATADLGSLHNIERIVRADELWKDGYTGAGVDVALVDTGVTPVPGLDDGRVIDGPDLSFDNGDPELRYLDSYGHGTHMAGIIAGRDPIDPACTRCDKDNPYTDADRYYGVAPDARIVNVKVGATDGAVDVTQVIAGINWVVDHKDDAGLHIRVLNLSFGTDAAQSYLTDPLSYAVQRAWDAGIVVLVASGNDGLAASQVANPATNPDIIAVGAADPNGTLKTDDDSVPAFANHGSFSRSVDVIAPATHVLSLRVPGSTIDLENPSAVVGERFIRGSGTSQATAVVSGVAALLVQKFPDATPDQIKAQLMATGRGIKMPTTVKHMFLGQKVEGKVLNRFWFGSGIVDAKESAKPRTLKAAEQANAPAIGGGSLGDARGSTVVLLDGEPLTADGADLVLPDPTVALDGYWDGNRWTGNRWTGNRWTGNRWTGNRWTGNRWTGNRWTGSGWSSNLWS
jgi:serine protease AprX